MPKIGSPLEGALDACGRGLSVFPLAPGSKIPARKGWQAWAARSTPELIEEYSRRNLNPNWGISTSGLFVFDLDCGKHPEALTWWEEILSQHSELSGKLFVVKTPSGGFHIYFRTDEVLPNSASLLAEGVDTRAKGGFVVCWGSRRRDGKVYKLVRDPGEIPALPAWLRDLYLSAREAKGGGIQVFPDEPVPEGQREVALYQLGVRMRREGFLPDSILAALQIENEKHLAFPLALSEVRHAWEEACKVQPEVAQAVLDFQIKPAEMKTISGDSLLEDEPIPREWVLQWQMARGFLSLVAAPGGTGKSLLGLSFGLSIVTGKPLAGFEVLKTGPVWYANLEDSLQEIHLRLAAARSAYGIDPKTLSDLHLSGREQGFQLATRDRRGNVTLNEPWLEGTVGWLKKEGIVAAIFDPLVLMHSLTENSNEEMGLLLRFLGRLLDGSGIALLVVHHTGKIHANDQYAGSQAALRGASALAAGARMVSTLSVMGTRDAERMGVNPDLRRRYLRLDNAKSNLFLPPEGAVWFEKVSQDVACKGGKVESIGVLKPWRPNPRDLGDAMRPSETVIQALYGALERLDFPSREPVVYSMRGLVEILASDPAGPLVLEGRQDRASREYLKPILSWLQAHDWPGARQRIEVTRIPGRGGNLEYRIKVWPL